MSEISKIILAAVMGGVSVFAIIFFYFIASTNIVSVEQIRGQDAKATCEWVILMDNHIMAGIECTW